MKGKHRVIVQNSRLRYDFEIKRNITIIQGDSATGKTTLIGLLRQAYNFGGGSGVEVVCDVPCIPLEGQNWKILLRSFSNSILFIDEENAFISSEEFARELRQSSNYVVLITRENLYNLPYSVEEIYGMHSSGKYQTTRKTYQTLYQIYPQPSHVPFSLDKVITEDTNSGHEFFEAILKERRIACISAGGKTRLFNALLEAQGRVCAIADGAAIGAEMDNISKLVEKKPEICLYLPESFEWILLRSGIIDGKSIQDILEKPEDYIESSEYFSWEQFFTSLISSETKDTYLHYRKNKINPVYLHDKNRSAIEKVISWLPETVKQDI